MVEPVHRVSDLPRPLPTEVVITDAVDFRATPNELRTLKETTGRTLSELLGPEAENADQLQTIAWLKLRREGHELSWEETGDLVIRLERATPDPTSVATPKTSPASAASGA